MKGNKGEKKKDNCNSIINKIYLKQKILNCILPKGKFYGVWIITPPPKKRKEKRTLAIRERGRYPILSHTLPSHEAKCTHGNAGESAGTLQMRPTPQQWGTRWHDPGSQHSSALGCSLSNCFMSENQLLPYTTAALGLLQQPSLYSAHTRHPLKRRLKGM